MAKVGRKEIRAGLAELKELISLSKKYKGIDDLAESVAQLSGAVKLMDNVFSSSPNKSKRFLKEFKKIKHEAQKVNENLHNVSVKKMQNSFNKFVAKSIEGGATKGQIDKYTVRQKQYLKYIKENIVGRKKLIALEEELYKENLKTIDALKMEAKIREENEESIIEYNAERRKQLQTQDRKDYRSTVSGARYGYKATERFDRIRKGYAEIGSRIPSSEVKNFNELLSKYRSINTTELERLEIQSKINKQFEKLGKHISEQKNKIKETAKIEEQNKKKAIKDNADRIKVEQMYAKEELKKREIARKEEEKAQQEKYKKIAKLDASRIKYQSQIDNLTTKAKEGGLDEKAISENIKNIKNYVDEYTKLETTDNRRLILAEKIKEEKLKVNNIIKHNEAIEKQQAKNNKIIEGIKNKALLHDHGTTKAYTENLSKLEMMVAEGNKRLLTEKELSEIETQRALTQRSLNKGTIWSNIKSNFSLQKLASRVSFVTTATMSYRVMQGIEDSFRAVASTLVNLQEQMSKTFSIIPDATKGMRSILTKGVIENMVKYGESLDNVGDALYKIVSAQIKPNSAISVLNEAGKLAKANIASIDETSKLLISIIKAYNIDEGNAQRIGDTITNTVRLGVTTGKELADNYSKVIPITSSLGISFEELSAVVATLTSNGIETDKAMTSLAMILQLFTNQSEKSKKILDQYGITLTATQLRNDGLIKSFHKLLPLMQDEQHQIATTKRGKLALMNIMSNENELYENYKNIIDGAGASQKALEERMNTFTAQLSKMKNGLIAAVVNFPIMQKALDGLTSTFKSFNAIYERMSGTSNTGEHKTIAGMIATDASLNSINEYNEKLKNTFNAYNEGKIKAESLVIGIDKINREFSNLGVTLDVNAKSYNDVADGMQLMIDKQKQIAEIRAAKELRQQGLAMKANLEATKEGSEAWQKYSEIMTVIQNKRSETESNISRIDKAESTNDLNAILKDLGMSGYYDSNTNIDQAKEYLIEKQKEMSVNDINKMFSINEFGINEMLKALIPIIGVPMTAKDLIKRLSEGTDLREMPEIQNILDTESIANSYITQAENILKNASDELLVSSEFKSSLEEYDAKFDAEMLKIYDDIGSRKLGRTKEETGSVEEQLKNNLLLDRNAFLILKKDIEKWKIDENVKNMYISKIDSEIGKIDNELNKVGKVIIDMRLGVDESLIKGDVQKLIEQYNTQSQLGEDEDAIKTLASILGIGDTPAKKAYIEEELNKLFDFLEDKLSEKHQKLRASLNRRSTSEILGESLGIDVGAIKFRKMNKENPDLFTDEEREAEQQRIEQELINSTIDNTKQLYSQLTSMAEQYYARKHELRMKDIEDERESAINVVNSEIMTSQHRQNEISAINNKFNKKKEKEEEKYNKARAKRERKLAMFEASMQYSLGLIRIWSQGGLFKTVAASVATTSLSALYAAQMAVLSNTKYFRDGGILQGNSHENGGINLYGRNGQYYGNAEGGEAIFSKKATSGNEGILMAQNNYLTNGGSFDKFVSTYLANKLSSNNKMFDSMRFSNGGVTANIGSSYIDESIFEKFALVKIGGLDERQLFRITEIGRMKDKRI